MTKDYIDDEVRYLGGHPKFDWIGPARLDLDDELVRISPKDEQQSMPLLISRGSIGRVVFESQRLGMSEAEASWDVAIGPDEWLVASTVVVVVKDPERIFQEGFRVRLGFRNDWYAKVFEKRLVESHRMPPF